MVSTASWHLRCVLMMLLCATGCDRSWPPVRGTVEQQDVSSTIVGDVYRILVRLPPGYGDDPARRYPVMYQLDATSFGPQFDIVAGHASALAATGRIPEAIVVGVGYPYEDPLIGGKRGRSRDYVTVLDNQQPGGLPAFLRFVREELFPQVEGQYHIDSSERALSGHSLGGFVALYTMLTTAKESAPPFSRFLACDPGAPFKDPLRLFQEEQTLAQSAQSLPAQLHYEIARYDGAVQQLWYEELTTRLRSHYPELTMTTKVVDTDHGGIMSPCFERGLTALLGQVQP